MKKKRRKPNFKKAVEALFAKKRYLSLACAVLSGALACAYVVYAVLCACNIGVVSEVMTNTADGLWGIQLVKYVGLSLIFSILGIVAFGVLGIYRALMVYYHAKIFGGDRKFFKEQRKGTIGFSFLALVMTFVFGFVYYNGNFTLPFVGDVGALVAAITYLVLALLPVIEIIGEAIVGVVEKRRLKKQATPDKDDIVEEIDALAERSVERATAERGEDPKTIDEDQPSEIGNERRDASDRILARFKKIGVLTDDEDSSEKDGDSSEKDGDSSEIGKEKDPSND